MKPPPAEVKLNVGQGSRGQKQKHETAFEVEETGSDIKSSLKL
jgi:hypothetical protein